MTSRKREDAEARAVDVLLNGDGPYNSNFTPEQQKAESLRRIKTARLTAAWNNFGEKALQMIEDAECKRAQK